MGDFAPLLFVKASFTMAPSLSPSIHSDSESKKDAVSVHTTSDHSLSTVTTPSEPINSYGARPAVFKSIFQEVLIVLIATMTIGTKSMAFGSIIVITSFVGKELKMSTAEIAWISASTSLASGSFLLLFGRRWMFVGSLLEACYYSASSPSPRALPKLRLRSMS